MDREFHRRLFLRGALLAGAGLASSGGSRPTATRTFDSPLIFHSPPMRPFVDELRRPPVISGSALAITAEGGRHQFHRDFDAVPALGYGGETYLGPTIEGQVGEALTLTSANRLGEHPLGLDMDTSLHGVDESHRHAPPTSLHLHGGVTPPDSDGHPLRAIGPGQDITHTFPNQQSSAHLWYHDHAMGITRLNVYAGLAGMFFLRDEYDTGRLGNPLGLPAEDFEMPLVLQEKIFTADGRQTIRSTPIVPQGSWEGGAVGDIGVVNGKVWPRMSVARGLYRFRIINGASYSVWNLHLSNGMPIFAIGNEHGFLDAPVPTNNFRLSPGERIDVLVDFSGLDEGDTVELLNDEQPPFQAAILGEIAMPMFCRFVADARRGFSGGIPRSLRGGPRQPALLPPLEVPTRTRTVTLSQPYALRIPPAIMSLNNLRFDSTDIEMPRQGTVEQWDIVNTTPDPHPIHLHLVVFRVLGRAPLKTFEYQAAHPQPPIGTRWTPSVDGFLAGPMSPAAPWESGWKDTVRADGGTVTRIVVRFPTADELGFDPDALFGPAHAPETMAEHTEDHSAHGGPTTADQTIQGYVWHCHILDHEDHDMMLKYRVVP
ncbi:multicopper oxidase domain-containing protein [Rhodococcus erythropolis]|uniref:multicopper oxidase family protein n=1 Tax=Rhodococcus erythropolis TaxID=1833 RepID=UPI001E310393|nr:MULTISPECIES: multicopper oxidase domain-containing protein [Rhodococcus erythropolis group]MCD2107908.1 multicopper oxidase domain-containing protein [Rhodococcus qingshengii]MCZ4527079.1 multicopper oxidase domain-containing protein [Rhodococcus erythropolis]